MSVARRVRLALFGTTLGAALFLGGLFAAPALDAAGSRGGVAVRLLYAPLCHQRAARSLSFDGHPLAVCARCTGLYLGGFAGLACGLVASASRLRRLRPRWLFFAVVPTATDAALVALGLPSLDSGPRLVSALPAGLVAGLFLASAIADLVSTHRVSAATPMGRTLEEVDA